MKALRIITIILLSITIIFPVVCFNFEPDSISLIDNRKLAENPFTTEEGDLTDNIENYVNDRIGLRDKIITAYTVLNDKIFGKMTHPLYTYGKDGYVFGAGLTTSNDFGDFHIAFADMVKAIQNYCEERNIPFLFVFNPAKPAIYSDKIADGINYNREWVDLFFEELDKRNVYYLDNTKTFRKLYQEDVLCFNQKYDANHWNDLGAFYGTQKMLEKLNAVCPTVHINDISEFAISEKLETSLLVSKFPIKEYIPKLNSRTALTSNLYNEYFDEIYLHSSYNGFGYYINEQKIKESSPKALVFQGSYMNGFGCKYFQHSFGEYIHIHDYQNVIDFPYYFNIFKPDCVIFEVAEYTFSSGYFNYENMKAIDYNPPLSSLSENEYKTFYYSDIDVSTEIGETLTVITYNTSDAYQYVWYELDDIYDMKKVENGYQVTIETSRYKSSPKTPKIHVLNS